MKMNSYRCLLLVATTLIISSSDFPGASGETRPIPQEAGEILRNLKAGPWSQGSVGDDGNILKVLINNPDGERLTELVQHFPALKHIYLSNNGNLSPQDLRHLRSLSNLESLELYSPKIDGSGFAHLDQLKKLRRLKLRRTNFQPENIRYLATSTGLEDLDLGWTPIGSKRSLDSLKILKELPRLETLQFEGANENQEMFKKILPGVSVYYLE